MIEINIYLCYLYLPGKMNLIKTSNNTACREEVAYCISRKRSTRYRLRLTASRRCAAGAASSNFREY